MARNADRDRKRFSKPRPPAHLTEAEADIWTRTCKDQTGDWCELAAGSALLEMYCIALAHYRLLCAARVVLMQPASEDDPLAGIADRLKTNAKLSMDIANQATHVAALGTKLRLTPQARIEPRGTQNDPPAPWDMHPDDDGDTA